MEWADCHILQQQKGPPKCFPLRSNALSLKASAESELVSMERIDCRLTTLEFSITAQKTAVIEYTGHPPDKGKISEGKGRVHFFPYHDPSPHCAAWHEAGPMINVPGLRAGGQFGMRQ